MDIEAIVKKHQEHLLKLENVVGIGEGEADGKPVIQVLVSRKVPRDELSASQLVPESIEGVPVKVLDVGIIQA
jgi:hypothetical protein